MPDRQDLHDLKLQLPKGWQPTPFREFVLKIHSRCDLACRYCYMYQMADQSWRSRPKRMSEATLDLVADRISEHAGTHSLKTVRVVFHGGEPLLAGPELIRYAVAALRSRLGSTVTFGMQTNAVLLDGTYLKLLDELDIHVGVSLDGGADEHDRHRRRANGTGSYAAVAAGLAELTATPFRHLFGGLLCTIDPRNDPVATYEALISFAPPSIDFLLPHGNWTTPPPGRLIGTAETPYGDWLAAVFDRWYRAPAQETRVRIFAEIMNLLMGEASATEGIGLSPVAVVTIETDGSIEQSDSLKSAYHGAPATGLHVGSASFDAVLREPSVRARQLGRLALSSTCRSCRIVEVCGSGLYAHRYREDNGFSNPSVYCPDLTRIINHIYRIVEVDVASLREVT
jgi:uncharacterized protein